MPEKESTPIFSLQPPASPAKTFVVFQRFWRSTLCGFAGIVLECADINMEENGPILLQMSKIRNFRGYWRWVNQWVEAIAASRCVCLFLNNPAGPITPKWVYSTGRIVEQWDRDFLARFINDSPAASLLEARPGLELFHMHEIYPSEDEWRKSAFYRCFMVPFDWDRALGIAIWQDKTLVATVMLFRGRDEGGYSREQENRLREALRYWQAMLSRLLVDQKTLELDRAVKTILFESEEAVVIVNLSGRICFINIPGRRALAFWERRPSLAERPPIILPPDLVRAVQRLSAWYFRAASHGENSDPHWREEISCPAAPDWKAILRIVRGHDPRPYPPLISIRFGTVPLRDSNLEMTPLPMHLLSRSERELVDGIRRGLNNAALAKEHGKAIGTVKHQLNSAFRKLGVPGRTALLVRLLQERRAN